MLCEKSIIFFCLKLSLFLILSKFVPMGYSQLYHRATAGKDEDDGSRFKGTEEKEKLEEESSERSLSDFDDYTRSTLLFDILLFSDDGTLDGVYTV